MQHCPEKIHWGAINSASEQPGVYAWYYSPRFTKFDRAALENALESGSTQGKIETFLDRYLLRYFKELPYEATMRGPLKPTFSGNITHQQAVTPDLAKRLAEDPMRREILWDAIESMAPFFSAPLYIGMAKNLRTRLRRHKSLIEGGLEKLSTGSQTSDYSMDAGFASEILRRGLPTERLFVYVLPLPAEAKDTSIDMENLLNRINYPVLGRN